VDQQWRACGTRGMGIRWSVLRCGMRREAAASGCNAPYRGYFRSGAISDPANTVSCCRSRRQAIRSRVSSFASRAV
jgi:hypothetical protein